jgi:hypothetical protein
MMLTAPQLSTGRVEAYMISIFRRMPYAAVDAIFGQPGPPVDKTRNRRHESNLMRVAHCTG